MGSEEIKRLRRNFIRSTMRSFMLVTLMTGFLVNLFLIVITIVRVRSTLNYLADQYVSGETVIDSYVDYTAGDYDDDYGAGANSIQNFLRDQTGSLSEKPLAGYRPFSIGIIQGIRYFAIAEDPDTGVVKGFDNMNMSELKDFEAVAMGRRFLRDNKDFGLHGGYFYKRTKLENGDVLLICLNYQEGLYSVYRLILASVVVIFMAWIVIYALVRNSSMKAIMPEIRNVRHQKEFITNASHELKTPLAVIKANTEFLEMTEGENEWTKSIMNQIDRMNGLIQNLVMISRSAEQSSENEENLDLTELLKETVDPFKSLVKREEKTMNINFQKDVHLVFDASKLRMLTTVLVDNAIKYCDDGGKINLVLSQGRNKKAAEFKVYNSYAAGANVDYRRFFERFYREDESHHIEKNSKSGYGVGLSVAESIASINGGRISVEWKNGMIRFKCVLRGK